MSTFELNEVGSFGLSSLYISSDVQENVAKNIEQPATAIAASSKAGQRRLRTETQILPDDIRKLVTPGDGKDLLYHYDKYKEFQFQTDYYKEFNYYPPEFKACLAGDMKAVETFLQYGWNLNISITKPHSGGGTPLGCLILLIGLSKLQKPAFSDYESSADMCLFLINHGANVNDAYYQTPYDSRGGLPDIIKTFGYSMGDERGIDVIRAAIAHGAILKGSLKTALNLPQEVNSEYKDQVIEILLNAGAKLD